MSASPRMLFTVALMVVLVTACAPRKPRDPDARAYRMYYDEGARQAQTSLEVRRFQGQLRLADLEEIFGPLSELGQGSGGNRIGGWASVDGRLWSLVAGPSLEAVNVVNVGLDGAISSALDVDGDRIADVVDLRTGGGERFTFVTERLGRELFEQWLLGRDPLCHDGTVAGLPKAPFGCPEAGSAAADEGAGSALPYDPWDEICAGYDTRQRPRPPVMAHGGHGYGSHARTNTGTLQDPDGRIRQAYRQTVYTDDEGRHVSTYTVIQEYDDEGRMTREVHERVDHEGQGTRRVVEHGADGTTKEHEESFETEVDEQGNYDPFADEEETPTPPADSGAQPSTPGPGGDPGSDDSGRIAQWCTERESHRSGVEEAAATDPSVIELDCDDLVRSSDTDPDCRLIEWAGADDFEAALEPPSAGVAGNCGPFEQPGPDGTCGTASGLVRLLGSTAWIGSAELEGIEICNPLVCDPSL